MGSENPGVRKLLPWGPLTPEGEEQLLAQTPGRQAMGLPAAGALPPPRPRPPPVTRRDVTADNVLFASALAALAEAWRQASQ